MDHDPDDHSPIGNMPAGTFPCSHCGRHIPRKVVRYHAPTRLFVCGSCYRFLDQDQPPVGPAGK